VLGYTRRQVVLLAVAVGLATGGLAVDRWRRANPDVVAYVESLDREPPPPPRAPAPAYQPAGPASPRAVAARPGERRAARAASAAPLDLNLASAADFERLPGVGPALAARIVDTRAREGPFGTVDDLRRVRGVGAATLARLRPLLAVNTP
jgi:competence ComEA-like helix-hairpin-helix protein